MYEIWSENICFQISVQCQENPEGNNGFVIYDMEAIPVANFLLPSKAKDHAKDEGLNLQKKNTQFFYFLLIF